MRDQRRGKADDFYTVMAALHFDVTPERVTVEQRRAAKERCFLDSYVRGECLLSGAEVQR